MVRLVTILVALVAWSVMPTASQGATIERYSDPEMGCDIKFSGVIETGDAAKLKGAISQSNLEIANIIQHPNKDAPMCSIPDDHIAPRRSALFMARWVLTEARDGRATC